MRKEETLKITTGAMFIAIFAMLLLINRQTGGLFQELFLYILPIPMVAYSAKYGMKTSIPVLIAMGLISLLFGTITTIFYAVSEAFIGMVFGSCIYRKIDTTKTMFTVMFLSTIVNVLNTVVLASLFGYDLTQEIAEIRTMMLEAFEHTQTITGNQGLEQAMQMITPEYMLRMFVISMVLMGILQGFLVFEISLRILNRLKFPVQRPKPVVMYFPPRWVGTLASALFCLYYVGAVWVQDEKLLVILQTVGICAYILLVAFGMIGLILYVRIRFTRNRAVAVILALVCFFVLPMLELVIGVIYTTTDYHRRWLNEAIEKGL